MQEIEDLNAREEALKGGGTSVKREKQTDESFMKAPGADNLVYDALAQRRRARREYDPVIEISDEEFKPGPTTLYKTSPDVLQRGVERHLTFRGERRPEKLDKLEFDPVERDFVKKELKKAEKSEVKEEPKVKRDPGLTEIELLKRRIIQYLIGR